MTRRKRKRRYQYYNNKRFHSKIELEVYKVLLTYFPDSDIERQKLYFEDKKFSCDFYFPNLSPPAWIEVSNYLKPRYLAKIKKKRGWIESRNEMFVFVSDPLILETQLKNFFSND